VIRRFAGLDSIAAERTAPAGPLVLSVVGRDRYYTFAVNDVESATVDGRALSTTVAGGFTGTMLGPHVDSADQPAGAPVARWDRFVHRNDQ